MTMTDEKQSRPYPAHDYDNVGRDEAPVPDLLHLWEVVCYTADGTETWFTFASSMANAVRDVQRGRSAVPHDRIGVLAYTVERA